MAAILRLQYGSGRGAAGRRPLTWGKIYRAALPAIVAAVALGCGPKPDAVSALIESLRAAAEDRDAKGVSDHLADEFRGTGGADKAETTATLRRYFAAYESVRVVAYDVAVTRRTDTAADVSCRVEFNGSARRIGGLDGFLPPSAVERFSLHLVRRGADWKVASAEWHPVEPVGSPAP